MLDLCKKIFEIARIRDFTIRTHPVCKLTSKQIDLLSGFNFDDCSNWSLGEIDFNNTVSISISSSSAIETAAYGCGVIWLPFLDQRSVIFGEILSKIGYVCLNRFDFEEYIKELNNPNKVKHLIYSTSYQYNKYFAASDDEEFTFEQVISNINKSRGIDFKNN